MCCFCSLGQIDTALSGLRHQNLFDTSVKTPLLLIADIAITGNKRTKPYIIEREIPFKQGDYVSKKDLETKLIIARQQVTNTSLFVDVYVYVASQQGELVFINVDVKERWYLFPLPYFKLIDRNFNEWWVEDKRSLDHADYGLKFMQGNISGRNDRLNISLINGYDHQVDMQYVLPLADRALKSGFSVHFLFSQQHELNYATDSSKQLFYKQDAYVRKVIRAEGTYLYRPAIKTRHSIRVSYVQEQVADTILKLNPNYFPQNLRKVAFPEFAYSLEYFNADYVAYPLHGFSGDFSFVQRGLSKNMDMTQFEFHTTYSHPFIAKTNIQFQVGGLLKVPFTQPFYNQQLFGYGDIFFRGLEYYVIDGVAGFIVRATERKKLFSFALKPNIKNKMRTVIPFTFYGKIYSDGGYAYNPTPGNSLLNNKMLYTYGAGIDIVSIYDAVFKFEYSFNQLGGQALFFHVEADF
jgi:outer membrane protein assembly factor BamA